MQATGLNRISRRLAATTGLLLMLVATTAGADPLDADAATTAASQLVLSEVAASEVDAESLVAHASFRTERQTFIPIAGSGKATR